MNGSRAYLCALQRLPLRRSAAISPPHPTPPHGYSSRGVCIASTAAPPRHLRAPTIRHHLSPRLTHIQPLPSAPPHAFALFATLDASPYHCGHSTARILFTGVYLAL